MTWTSKPSAFPGTLSGNTTVEHATLKLNSLRLIADAGSVSIPTGLDLVWDTGAAPANIAFPMAPAGLYSKLALRVDSQLLDNSYWILGHTQLNGMTMPFKIYDRDFLELSLSINDALAPSGSATVSIEVDFDSAIGSIDWSKVDVEDGALVLDTFDPYMLTFRQKIAQSFVISSHAE